MHLLLTGIMHSPETDPIAEDTFIDKDLVFIANRLGDIEGKKYMQFNKRRGLIHAGYGSRHFGILNFSRIP